MFTKTTNDAEKLFERAEDHASAKGLIVMFPNEEYLAFKQTIKDIAKTSAYKSGEKIIPSDLERIKNAVVPLLTGMSANLANRKSQTIRSQEARAKNQILPDLLSANDYFFAYALKELGNPSIPPNFGHDIENKIADLALESDFKVTNDDFLFVTTDRYFDAQRKRDAKDMEGEFKTLGSPLRTNRATPLDVAQYAAEYQALKRRQDNHNRFWRFFHKSENAARVELLNTMKATLKGVLGEDAEIDTKTPKELAEAFHKSNIQAQMKKECDPNGICVRCDNFDPKAISHEATDDTRARQEEAPLDNNDLSANLRESLKEKNTEKLSVKAPEEPKAPISDIVSVQ